MNNGQKEDFRCPICGPQVRLEWVGERRVETLMDHVCDPNGDGSIQDMYQCPIENCPAREWQFDPFGDAYFVGDWENRHSLISIDDLAIDKNFAPFGSIRRRTNVENDKKGVKGTFLCIWPKWYTLNWGLEIEWKYSADEWGKIQKRWLKFKGLRRTKDGGCTLDNGVFNTIWRHLAWFRSCRKDFFENPDSFHSIHTLHDFFKPLPTYEKRRWRKFCHWVVVEFYPKTAQKLISAMARHINHCEKEIARIDLVIKELEEKEMRQELSLLLTDRSNMNYRKRELEKTVQI